MVSTLILAGLLIFFELVLRFFWQMSGLKGEIYQRSADTTLRYELKPHAKIGEDIIINSGGFRDKEYPFKKAEDTYRITVIGDSVTFGRAMKLNETLPKRLQETLFNLCPNKKFEVLNMGTEGYNSIQELEFLKRKGLKYNPDLVIIYYCLNDPDYPEYYFTKNFINRHSLLARYILYRIKKRRIKMDRIRKGIKSDVDAYQYFYSSQCWQDTKEVILEMADLTQAHGIRMVLLIAPEMQEAVKDFRDGYPFWYINNMLEGIRHDNIVVVDPIREFSKINLRKEELTIAGSYPNLKANNIIAEYTIQTLKEKNMNLCN